MEFVVRSLRGWAVPLVMPIARAWQIFDEAGWPKDPAIEQQVRALGAEVVRAARQFGVSGSCDDDDAGVVAGWTARS
jgi:FMN reductase